MGDVLGEPGRKLARSAANISPEARETMNQALNARGEAQGARAHLAGWITSLVSPTRTPSSRRSTPPAAQRDQPGLSGGRAAGRRRAVVTGARTAGQQRGRQRRHENRGQDLQDEAVRRGMGGFNPKISFTPDNRIQFNRGPTGVPTYPDLRYWDQVRRELSDAAMKAGRGTEENMRLGGLAKALNDEFDRAGAGLPDRRGARRPASSMPAMRWRPGRILPPSDLPTTRRGRRWPA